MVATRLRRWSGTAHWWNTAVSGNSAVRYLTWAAAVLLLVSASWSFVRAPWPGTGIWSLPIVQVGVGVLLAAGQSLPMIWWRSRAFMAWLVLVASYGAGRLCELLADLQPGRLSTPGQFAGVLVLCGAGMTLARWRSTALAATTVVVLLLSKPGAQLDEVLFVTVTAVLLGMSAAARRRAESDLVRERLAQSQLADRTRIARELHDVVAHHMSVVAVQAETARFRLPGTTDAQAEEFAAIAATSRQALDEMRRLLGALRAEGRPEHAPQPTLRDVPELVASVRRTASAVRVELDDRLGELPAMYALAAYRIVQEALSNAVKHAPGTEIDLAVTIVGRMLHIRVGNDLAGGVAPGTDGLGVLGMRERATLLGGSLTAGPRDGRFEVQARIPLPEGDS